MGRRQYAGRNPITGQKLSWEYVNNNVKITKICKEQIQTCFNKLRAHETKVLCLNTGKIFLSIKDAANWCNLKSSSNISEVAKGKRKTAGKHPVTKEPLYWKYVD